METGLPLPHLPLGSRKSSRRRRRRWFRTLSFLFSPPVFGSGPSSVGQYIFQLLSPLWLIHWTRWLAGRREGYGYLITRWDYRIFFSVASFLILAAAGHGSRLQVSSCCCGIAVQQSNDDDVKICHQATVLGEEEDGDWRLWRSNRFTLKFASTIAVLCSPMIHSRWRSFIPSLLTGGYLWWWLEICVPSLPDAGNHDQCVPKNYYNSLYLLLQPSVSGSCEKENEADTQSDFKQTGKVGYS